MQPITYATVCLVLTHVALADIEVGSDGSDGVFNPQADVVVDLSLATTVPEGQTWQDTPGNGNGVYDPDEWAVVFKFISVDIPPGVTVSFKNHPTRAPVVFLSQTNITINGTLDLSGTDGHDQVNPVNHAEPGPGGFRGGRSNSSSNTDVSGGFGPGGAALGDATSPGSAGSYATQGQQGTDGAGLPGPTYGNTMILPLIGGSGGSAGQWGGGGGGGAGGGAILLGANATIHVGESGRLDCNGGGGGNDTGPADQPGQGGSGAGGAIRILSDVASIDIGAQITALGGTQMTDGGDGRIRIDANDRTQVNQATVPAAFVGDPTTVFPPPCWPQLRAKTVDTESVPDDPNAAFGQYDPDVQIETCDPVQIAIEAENMPEGTIVQVRVASATGDAVIVDSTPLTMGIQFLEATATVAFEPGFSAVQLHATFDPQTCGEAAQAALPKTLRDFRTVTGERIARVDVFSDPTGRTRARYFTEGGTQIPLVTR